MNLSPQRAATLAALETLSVAAPVHPVDERLVEVWLAGEWKKLAAEESREIVRRQAAGEVVIEMSTRKFSYRVDLRQMTQTNLRTGRTRTIRVVDAGHQVDSTLGFDEFRTAFRKLAPDGRLTEQVLLGSWPATDVAPGLLRQTVKMALEEMDLRKDGKVDLVQWDHYWALERDNTPFHSGMEVNDKLKAALLTDPQVLGRMQMHFETAVNEAGASTSLSSEGLVRVCERLVSSPKDVVEKKWAAEVLRKAREGEGPDEDADLSYYDFLNVMLGRKRFKVSLWMYDISDGIAKRWSWLLLGQNFDGIWHTGTVIEWPNSHHTEFWFGGAIFASKPGTTPFQQPVEKRTLGYTYKLREETWDYIRRNLASEFTKENYDVLTHNCNHFSEKLSVFLRNDHIPTEVLHQPDMVMSTLTARALRPFLNRWLGGFDTSASKDGRATDGGEAAIRLWQKVRRGALVEFCKEEGGRLLVGEVIHVSERECFVRCLDFWCQTAVERRVARPLVTKVVAEAPHSLAMAEEASAVALTSTSVPAEYSCFWTRRCLS